MISLQNPGKILNSTNKIGGFELVPKPSSAVGKTMPGTKRVLLGMVSDTLALVKKKSSTKTVFTLFIGHRGGIGHGCEKIIRNKIGQQYDLNLFRFGIEDDGFYPDEKACSELLKLTQEQPFDLIFVYSCCMTMEEIELFARIKAQYGKPIVFTSGWGGEHKTEQLKELERIGIPFIQAPFTVEEFWHVLQICLKLPPSVDTAISRNE